MTIDLRCKLQRHRQPGCLARSCWECYFYTFRSSLRPTTAEGHTAVWTRARAANPLQSSSTKG